MSPLSRRVLRHAAPAAFFACGVAFLAAGWPAGFAWTLIVVSLGWAAQRANAVAPPSDLPRDDRLTGGQQRDAVQHRHLAESRRTLSRPR
jgi:hypothetical protein